MEETLKILESVNSFYSQSFNQLIAITVAVLTFAGVVLPILIFLYQKRLFKLEQEEIKSHLKHEIDNHIAVAVAEMHKEFLSSLAALESKIDKQHARSKGETLHLQAKLNMSEGHYLLAFNSLVRAGKHYIQSDTEVNLRRIINILKECILKLDGAKVEQDEESLKNYEAFIKSFEEYNANDRYKDDISSLKRHFKIAMSRRNDEV